MGATGKLVQNLERVLARSGFADDGAVQIERGVRAEHRMTHEATHLHPSYAAFGFHQRETLDVMLRRFIRVGRLVQFRVGSAGAAEQQQLEMHVNLTQQFAATWALGGEVDAGTHGRTRFLVYSRW